MQVLGNYYSVPCARRRALCEYLQALLGSKEASQARVSTPSGVNCGRPRKRAPTRPKKADSIEHKHSYLEFLRSLAGGALQEFSFDFQPEGAVILVKTLAACDLVEWNQNVNLDELGFTPLDQRLANVFDGIIASRNEQRSLTVTSNKSIESWVEAFPDPVIGDSYRMKDLKQRQKETPRPRSGA